MGVLTGLRRRTAQGIAALVLASVIGAVAYEAPGQFRARAADRGAYADLTDQDRLFLPARAYDVDLDLYKAAVTLPLAARFAFASGPNTYASSPLVLSEAGTFAHFFLLPRRLVAPKQADWVLSYGAEPAAFAVPLGERIVTGDGRFIAPVVRP